MSVYKIDQLINDVGGLAKVTLGTGPSSPELVKVFEKCSTGFPFLQLDSDFMYFLSTYLEAMFSFNESGTNLLISPVEHVSLAEQVSLEPSYFLFARARKIESLNFKITMMCHVTFCFMDRNDQPPNITAHVSRDGKTINENLPVADNFLSWLAAIISTRGLLGMEDLL